MRKTKSEAQADATSTDTTTNSPTSSRSSVWRRLSLVRENPNEAQADVTRVDTTTTTAPTPSPEMVALRLVRACPGATISANAVGVFYRGIFLRPMYTAECDTAPTSMHIDALTRSTLRLTPSGRFTRMLGASLRASFTAWHRG